uniref:Uncharacterized protein n=1 Tax=Setaria digitata TaxID=48799 RepID=A0A915PSJ1_9BILA
MTIPTAVAIMDTSRITKQRQQQRETLSPSPVVVLRSTPGRTTWTKRLSKTIQRRSSSFLNTLVPFRKSIDHSHSNTNDDKLVIPLPLHHKRHASASPAISVQTSAKGASSPIQEKFSTVSVATASAATAGIVALISSSIQKEDINREGNEAKNGIHGAEGKQQPRKERQKVRTGLSTKEFLPIDRSHSFIRYCSPALAGEELS